MVKIRVNGETREISDKLTVQDLLQCLNLDPKFLAVERNRQLIPRADHANCALSEGDEIEIVTLVGGG